MPTPATACCYYFHLEIIIKFNLQLETVSNIKVWKYGCVNDCETFHTEVILKQYLSTLVFVPLRLNVWLELNVLLQTEASYLKQVRIKFFITFSTATTIPFSSLCLHVKLFFIKLMEKRNFGSNLYVRLSFPSFGLLFFFFIRRL